MVSSHEVMSECYLGVEAEVEAHAPEFDARDTASPSASVSIGVVIGGAIVIVRHCVVSLVIFGRPVWVYPWVVGAVRLVTMFVVRPFYIIFVVLYETVGVCHRSRIVWRRRGVVCIREGVFLTVCRYVGWGRSAF